MATGRTGPVGLGLTPDGATLLVNCGEAAGSEDGGDEVTAIDVGTREVVRRIPLAEAAGHPAAAPSRFDSPHPSFGRWPNPTGLAISPLQGGLAFIGNGGFADVSVLSIPRALAGDRNAEVGRVAVETGPFGLAASPDGRLVAVAARESMSEAREGRTISIIDVERAAAGGATRRSPASPSAAMMPLSRPGRSRSRSRRTAGASSPRASARIRSRSSTSPMRSPVGARR